MSSIKLRNLFAAACAAGCCLAAAFAQQAHNTWQQYLQGSDSSHYSALKQINRSNVARLQVAWSYPTDDKVHYSFNPIIIGNVMYVLANNFSVVALDAASGKEIWTHPTRTAGRRRSMAGVPGRFAIVE